MSASLKARSLKAVFWSALEALSRQGVQFLITIILARLLAPEDFGTIAMLTLFIGLASIFVDGGFSSALIQKAEITAEESTAVFFFNLLAGAFSALLLVAFAPWIASFFNTPVLAALTRLMALNLFLTAFGSVHSALLTRDLDFKTQTHITLAASLLSGVVAVLLAWRGWGVWSLAIQALIATVVSTLLLWAFRPWRPTLRFQFRALRGLVGFGGYLFASALLEVVYSRAYALLIGKLYSTRTLGYFTRADTTQQIPSQMLSTIINRVLYPVFSSVARQGDLMRRGLRQAIGSLMLINVPLMLGMMAVSDTLVVVLFGTKWRPCVPYLQILCLSGLMWPLHVANLNALKALGRSDLFFRVEVIKKVLGFATLIGAVLISIMALAWSRVILSLLCFFLNAHYSGRLLGYSPARQLLDVAPCLAAGGVMALVMSWAGPLLPFPPAAALGVQTTLGIVLYAGLCWVLRINSFLELLRQIRSASGCWRTAPTP